MSKAVLLVYSNPPAGREEACAKWYDDTHLTDMLGVTGIVKAERYLLEGTGAQQIARDGSTTTATFLAVYSVEDADEQTVRASVVETVGRLREQGRFFDGLQVVSSAFYRSAA